MKPADRSAVGNALTESLEVSERRVCRTLEWSRTSVRYKRIRKPDSAYAPTIRMLAEAHPRFGYRRLHAMLRRSGVRLSRARVLRISRAAGMLVRHRRKRRPAVPFERKPMPRAASRTMGWALDFTSEQLVTGERFRILTVLAECTREIVACRAARSFRAADVITLLQECCSRTGGAPAWIRSDNGSEFVAHAAGAFYAAHGITHARSRPGKPTDNARIESFHSRFRDELLDRVLFDTVRNTQDILDKHTAYYNNVRPHSSLNYATPAEFAATTPRHRAELAQV